MILLGRFSLPAYCALGAVMALGLPPLSQVWLTVVAVSALVLLEARLAASTLRQSFLRGWAFGFGYFCVALHWIGYAFLVDAATYLWMMPFAVGGLSLFLASYWGLGFLITEWLCRRGFIRWITLACVLSVMEMLRGQLLTGFPWAAPGLMADASREVLQLASAIGMPGLTLLVLLWGMAPAVLVQRGATAPRKVLAALVLLLLPLAYWSGADRVSLVAQQNNTRPLVRLVQPNISQSDKWREENAAAVFNTLLRLTEERKTGAPDIIIWPESALAFLLDETPEALTRIADVLLPNQTLVTGAIRRNAEGRYFTSILVIDTNGKVIGTYDKWRLVPGGEFLPFATLLEPLGFRKLVTLPESFTAGPGPRNIDIAPAGPANMQICYEAIFPFNLVPTTERPSWMVNVTNDGWFGLSVGPYQHLAQARMRAVEQGLPLARAANTGLSAVIDGHGRIKGITQLGTQDVLDVRLPEPLAPGFFARFGVFANLGMFLLLIAIAGYPCIINRQP